MLRIDVSIYDTNKVICKNIDRFDDSERGLLSQNILGQLRNFVEYIITKIIYKNTDVDPNDYELKQKSISQIKALGQYSFLYKFHSMLQKSVSHYTVDEDGSERLMLKYYEYLLKIKVLFKKKFNIIVLENIDKFPLDTDKHFQEYYEKIADKVELLSGEKSKYDDRCYIYKIKPFFINEQIYYEVTFTVAIDNVSKFDRLIAFTKYEITDNYAVKLALRDDTINIKGRVLPIKIIDDWQVSVRPCELEKLALILGDSTRIKSDNKSYMALMDYLTLTKLNFYDLVTFSYADYNNIKNKIIKESKSKVFFRILDKCREIILQKQSGWVIWD